jgi:two-component system phosphate regulon sensor histidine kinase PhoR
VTFRLKLFLAGLLAAIVALAVAGVLFAAVMRAKADAQIERTLEAEARLARELLERDAHAPIRQPPDASETVELDGLADRIGGELNARVTLIKADGVVVGDTDETLEGIAAMENHGTRPEVVAARDVGIGRARRYSATLKIDMEYVAVPVHHPVVGFVRVALPLTDIQQQLGATVSTLMTALGIALACAIAIAFLTAGRIGHRVLAISTLAERYRRGDLTPAGLDFGDDELGVVARTFDDSVQEVGRRLGELARDRGRMEAVLAGMIEGVMVVDPQGRVQLANDAARQILRLDEFPVGRHYLEALRHPAIAELVRAALASQSASSVEFSPARDPLRTIIARAAPATSGAAHGVVLVLHDVSELKQADRIRRDFVANVSHELRTPLTAIRGYVEALGESDDSPEERRRFLEIIERNSQRMERLVRDLLRLARLDAGQETLEIATCDTKSLLQTVVSDVAPSIDLRRQRVEIAVWPGAESVRADPGKLHDAVRNLVANASTYGPEDSTIRIDASPEDSRVAISVSDAGPGLPEEDLSRVFERFYRVEKSRARDPGGTGLGLSIVKHLVELHGGHARVENRPEGGAKFTVTV